MILNIKSTKMRYQWHPYAIIIWIFPPSLIIYSLSDNMDIEGINFSSMQQEKYLLPWWYFCPFFCYPTCPLDPLMHTYTLDNADWTKFGTIYKNIPLYSVDHWCGGDVHFVVNIFSFICLHLMYAIHILYNLTIFYYLGGGGWLFPFPPCKTILFIFHKLLMLHHLKTTSFSANMIQREI